MVWPEGYAKEVTSGRKGQCVVSYMIDSFPHLCSLLLSSFDKVYSHSSLQKIAWLHWVSGTKDPKETTVQRKIENKGMF
jgi:hypothetical protein